MTGEMRLISQAGKTFYFATLWLAKRVRYDAALAYDFCRTVDDIADGTLSSTERDTQLREIGNAVLFGDCTHTLVRPLEPLLTRYPEIREPLAALVEACRQDGPNLTIRDEDDLERYAHGVAGNVGLIMYPILGGHLATGRSFAADLGIAMQYTNIARDVFEDLARERVYLPTIWLEERHLHGLLERTPSCEDSAVTAVRRLLRLADERYARGLSGLGYLAPENRFAIKVAARCYAAIGERVIRDGRLARERAVVPLSRKVVLACSMGFSSGQKLAWETVTCKP
jgi:phytoene synthase